MLRLKRSNHPNLGKREFLLRSFQGLAGVLGLPLLRPVATSGATEPEAELHVHPQYRNADPLDPILLKIKPGLDSFITEVYNERLSTSFSRLSEGLRRSPSNSDEVALLLAAEFAGTPIHQREMQLIRSGSSLTVHRAVFSNTKSLDRDGFLQQWQAMMREFSKIHTAEFQVTGIGTNSSALLRTRVRYELVGEGKGFYREQRAGQWELIWQEVAPNEWRVREWAWENETRSRTTAPSFVDIASQSFASNKSYTAQLVPGVDYWRTVIDGASGIDVYGHNGVSVGDIDGDGFDDLYVCQPAGLPNRLFRNRGDGTFEDITVNSGVGILDNTACAIFADFDNNGRQDLVVVRASGPLLFVNEGGARFRAAPDAFHFANPPQGTFTGAAAADYDRDGYLDIYFCLYAYYQGAGQYRYPSPYYDADNGPPNFLMRNNRDGTFTDVTAISGMNRNNTRFSFCCGWSDYNNDGWPDLYVANDFGRKNLYHNNGNGTFSDVAQSLGVEDLGAGMSVCWLDSKSKGREDLYVADMWTAAGERISMQQEFQKEAPLPVRDLYRKHAMGNSLFQNNGHGAFEDTTAKAGLSMGRWSWSADSWDFDHDGFADLYVVNGMLSGPDRYDLDSFFWRQVVGNSPSGTRASYEYEQGWNAVNELIRADSSWSGYERNVFYANNRDGTFSDVSGAVGLDFLEDGRAFALADFDRDGRQEVIVKNRSGPQLRVLKNVIPNLPPSIAFRLRGAKSNRDAIGAAVTIETERGTQMRRIQAGSGFLSQHSKELCFGLGDAQGPVHATIQWPSGLVQRFERLPAGHTVHIEEGAEPSRMEPFRKLANSYVASQETAGDQFPSRLETWLLAPIAAPDFILPGADGRRLSSFHGKPALLSFCNASSRPEALRGVPLIALNVEEQGSEDTIAVYNILYRYLFDRHRDLGLPTSFLIDDKGDIVKVYQGPFDPQAVIADAQAIPKAPAERLIRALPFPGVSTTYAFARNSLSYGSVFFQRGYYEQAGVSFQLALVDDPNSAEALYGIGSVYLKQENFAQARVSFDAAIRRNASYPDTLPNSWNNIGLLDTREGKIDGAIRCFQEALRLSPDHFVALQNLGNAYRQSNQWDDARATLEHALKIRPRDPEANYSLGMVFAQTGDATRALEYLKRALQANPAYPEALNNLGILYLRTRRRDEAVAQFQEAIRVAPGFDQAYLNLARVYDVEGDREKEKAVLLQLLKQHPGHAGALQALRHVE